MNIENLTVPELKTQITQLAKKLNAGTYQFIMLIFQLDAKQGWIDSAKSCAHWLNQNCGLCLNAAREHVRVAHALTNLPQITNAFRQGDLSYSKVRAMTRIAKPENEKDLLERSLNTPASHVENIVRRHRGRPTVLECDRDFAFQQHPDDSITMKIHTSSEAFGLFLKAFEKAYQRMQGRSDSIFQSRADALKLVAQTYLNHNTDVSAETFYMRQHVSAETSLQ